MVEKNEKRKLNGKVKSDKVEYAKRIKFVVEKLLGGWRVVDLVVEINEKYGVAEAQAYTYIKEATAVIHQKIEGSLEEKVNAHYQRLAFLYRKCVDDGDKTTARAVLKDISALLGLDAPKRTDITTNGEKLSFPVVRVIDERKKA